MTLLSRTGYSPELKHRFHAPKEILSDQISIVIPVRNNHVGIARLLSSLDSLYEAGQNFLEVIVVDNLSDIPIMVERDYLFKLNVCKCTLPGPAAARNVGSVQASGEWLLFIDSDCMPTKSTIAGYCKGDNSHLAYAGNVTVEENDVLSKYYADQETLIPPKARYDGKVRPDYLVTANCLVLKDAFNRIGGFDESFVLAGGEDIDLGFRLLCHGSISYQWESEVKHSFSDGLFGFYKRFRRYGVGNRILSSKYNLNLAPKMFFPNKVTVANILLSHLQYQSMRQGYRTPQFIEKSKTVEIA